MPSKGKKYRRLCNWGVSPELIEEKLRDCWTDLGNTNRKTETSGKQAYSMGYRELMHFELISYISHLGIQNVQKQIERVCRENIMPFTAPR